MKRIKRISTDQISVNPPDPSNRWSILASMLLVIAISFALAGCRREPTSSNSNAPSEKTAGSSSGPDAASIIERNRALDSSRDSTMKLRARISGSGSSQELNAPREIQFTIYRKHEPDGRHLIVIEFTSPAEERDRDALITAFPDGRVEGVRYVQSTDSFIVAGDAASEDALFGMTLQELAEGQPEKYAFSFAGDDTYNGTPVYRM
jgi:hypothetical protein